jgi:hypothetical protein
LCCRKEDRQECLSHIKEKKNGGTMGRPHDGDEKSRSLAVFVKTQIGTSNPRRADLRSAGTTMSCPYEGEMSLPLA